MKSKSSGIGNAVGLVALSFVVGPAGAAELRSVERQQAEAVVGQRIEGVAAKWGTPARSIVVGSETHYVWLRGQAVASEGARTSATGTITGNTVVSNARTTPGRETFVGCEITLRVDSSSQQVVGFTLTRHKHPSATRELVLGAISCR